MKQVKIVKAGSYGSLEKQINRFIEDLRGAEVYDVNVGGAYDGDDEVFIAAIVYER
ncbi:hypothetical protein PVJ1_00001 [Psychrobacillus phage PVJ1]|nr:hypothetical protein PVJ1_00001 [Psychrobacillus phage PVJ1]